MDDSAPWHDGNTDLDEPATAVEDTSDHQLTTGRRVVLGLGLAVLTAVTCWLFGHLPWVVSGFSWPTTEAAPVGSSSEGLAGVRLTVPLVAAFLSSLIAFTTIVTAAVAAVLGTLASLQVGFLPLAAGLAAGQVPVWVSGFLVDRGPGIDTRHTAGQVSHWLVFVVLLVAFVLSVRRSAAWVLLWPVAIALVWVAVPFQVMTTMLSGQLRPSSGLPDTLPDILQGGLDTFRASFWQAPQARWPWAAAVLVAVAWTTVERGIRKPMAETRR